MSSDIAIRVEGLSKCYRLYDDPSQRLWEALPLVGRSKRHREFWALRDITLEIRRGESVAIIGRNGSGKSTLLQCIAGTLSPSDGTVEVTGRVGALLELGTGFDPEFTGRENVYLAAGVLGLSRKETEARFAEIEDFADIGEFIEQPIKSYSSGMIVRLAFAVQTSVDPEVLIVDEALAVGDVFFQQKCLARMRALKDRGTTVLFVSHDMGLVRDLTQKAAYLRQGHLMSFGESHLSIHQYLDEGSSLTKTSESDIGAVVAGGQDSEAKNFISTAFWVAPEKEAASLATIEAVNVVDSTGQTSLSVEMGRALTFRVLYCSQSSELFNVSVSIKNKHGQVVISRGSYTERVDPPSVPPGSRAVFELETCFSIEAGEYTFCVKLALDSDQSNRNILVDHTEWLGPIRVQWDYESKRAPFLGMFGVPVTCRFLPSGTSTNSSGQLNLADA
jgi:lipopolysaccharide transport system ATP-binding protein